jgi:membrane fusion protein (multidrug efflux system)
VDQAQAQLASAQATERNAALALVEGRIGMANVSVGNFVNQATGTLATIVSQDPIYVLFPATTQQVLDYRQRTARASGGSARAVVHAILPNG